MAIATHAALRARHPFPAVLLALCLAGLPALVGCGGGGGAAAAPPPAAPQPSPMQVTARPDPTDFNKAALAWNLPAASDGVQIEVQVDGGGYQFLTNLPMATSDLTVVFDPATPERHTFGFRVTALHTSSVIAQAETSYRRSLRPALSLSSDPKPASGAMGVSWSKDATSVATGFVLERQMDGGAWAFVAPGAQKFQVSDFSAWDLSPVAEGEANYRVVPTFGDERGMPMVLRTRMPLLPPDRLSATPAAGGRTLSWVNQSRLATTLAIYRCTWGPADLTWTAPVLLGQVPATETGYFDPASPATGRVAYQVVASLPGTGQTESNWCLAGGPSSLPDLGLARSLPVLPFRPLLRDLDGAWMGFQMAEDPTIPPRLARTPTAAGFPLTIPFLAGGGLYTSWDVAASLAPSGVLDLQMIESGPPSFGPVTVHGFRWSSGAWAGRTFTRASGLSFGAGGFLADGTILAFSVDSNWQRGLLRLGMDGTATLESDPFPAGVIRSLSRPAGTPTGEALSLVQGGSGWMLGVRSVSGAWSLQAIPELDPAIFGDGCLQSVLVDATGTLHALFAAPVLGGYRYDYLRIRAGGVAELQSLGSGGSAYGLVGQVAATADGQRVGFALMDDSGQLRMGLRSGTADWNLKTALVPDAGTQGSPLFLQCGFRPDGRLWVLHNRVAHPFPVRYESYCELLEEP